MYAVGEGVVQDYDQAIKWLCEAAEQGHDGAQAFLVLAYDAGVMGVTKDDVEAAKWYRMYGNREDGPDSNEMDLQGISITRKHFFQRLSADGIDVCLSTLETNDARIEIKDNQFTLSDIGSPSGSGVSAPLNVLFDEKVDYETQPPPSGISDQLRGEVFLTKEDIPILKAFLVGIKVRARVKEKVDEAERSLSKVYGVLTADVEAFQIDVIRLWRDEIALQSEDYDEEIIDLLTDRRHQIHGSIDQLLEALYRHRRTITVDVVALTEKDNT